MTTPGSRSVVAEVGVVLLLCAVGFYVLGKLVFGGKAYAMYAKASIQSKPTRLVGFKGFGALLAFAVVIGLAILPHFSVILTSLAGEASWYDSVFPKQWTR